MLRKAAVPLALLAILAGIASLDLPLGWLARWGSWVMVVAAVGLAWALWRRRS